MSDSVTERLRDLGTRTRTQPPADGTEAAEAAAQAAALLDPSRRAALADDVNAALLRLASLETLRDAL